MVKFTHLISKEGENNKCYVKYVFFKVFKNSVKLLMNLFLVMLRPFFTHTALKGKLNTQRALQGNSKGTLRGLAHSDTGKALGHSST